MKQDTRLNVARTDEAHRPKPRCPALPNGEWTQKRRALFGTLDQLCHQHEAPLKMTENRLHKSMPWGSFSVVHWRFIGIDS